MTISLLHPEQNQAQAEPISERILYHLSIDRAFSYICSDAGKREQFLSVASNLTDNKEEILYRQEILQDFEQNPMLLEQLLSLSVRFEELQSSQKIAEKDSYRIFSAGTASLVSAKNILQVRALCLKRALLFVKAYGELLETHSVQSRGLTALDTFCKELYDSSDFDSLLAFCSNYEHFSASGFWNFRFALDETGRIGEFELIDRKYTQPPVPPQKKKSFSFFKKTEENVYPCEHLAFCSDGLLEKLEISALSDLSGLFKNLSEQIFARFGALGKELVFYEVARKYIDALKEKCVPICYPTFSQTQNVKVQNLYDLYLLMSKPDPNDVIPNDLILQSSNLGLLVYGNNGSGKTVYLRSVGTMQILAQAGLPVPCKTAELTLFSQLATQFSESEKEFCKGNDAGRFEQEVRELAVMVDALKSGSLVFLNETFQSTAYAEGAQGLYHLLQYFSSRNIRWILVTHLHELENMFDHGETTVLHTTDGYRITAKQG